MNNSLRVCWRSPGKIILFGEHFVVKGRPALAIAVNLYAKTIIEPAGDGYTIYSKNLGITSDLSRGEVIEAFKPFKKILEVIIEEYGAPKPFMALIDSEIPVSAGMGSSASTAVSFTAAVLDYMGIEPRREVVNRIAFKGEEVTHGKPSGIDNTLAVYGGFIRYESGRIRRLSLDLPENTDLLAVDTGVPRNTGVLVRKVLERYQRYPEIFSHVYDAASMIVDEAVKAFQESDPDRIGELMDINHGLLVSIGVSIFEIEKARYIMAENGAYGSKLTGAGGGGLVIGLMPSDNLRKTYTTLNRIFNQKTYVLDIDHAGLSRCREAS